MAIDENLEERVAQHRGRTRQSKTVPFLIRDDGALFPNVPLIAKKQRFRPYHGPLGAPLNERMQYLRGGPGARRQVVDSSPTPPEQEPFDLAAATKDELIAFAEQEYGVTIDPATHMNKIKADVARLAGIEPSTIFGRQGGLKKEAAQDAAPA